MELKFCKNCVMDGTTSELVLDENGVCNFCKQAQKSLHDIEEQKKHLQEVIEQIKKDGEGKRFDCLIGLSGGVDSSFTLHHALKLGLRPLCFTLDNKMNDERADRNIRRLVEKLGVPFIVATVDAARYATLQDAFIRAGQKNIEIPTDHILMAITYAIAEDNKIKWILSGGNTVGESIMPKDWGYQARDLVHIKDIYKKATGDNLKGLPMCGLLKWNWYHWVKRIRIVNLPDYLDYNIAEAKAMLEKEYEWEDYGNKHEENKFTKWFQSFYLFEKFGIDKRKAHYSSLINAGQMTRAEAMEALKEPPEYPDMGLPADIVDRYPYQPYTNFKTDEKLYEAIRKVVRFIKKYGR